MAHVTVADQEQRTLLRRSVLASMAGGVLEWYDFTLYGNAAALVFGQLFFPKFSPLAATLAAFASYAAGFFARPFGGIVFGHLGDKLGRKTILLLTVVLMGIATFCMGLLPTYAALGVGAPLLLVLLRLIQGFAGGAEQSGAVILVSEFAPQERRGFYASLPLVGIQLGILVAAGVFAIFSSLPRAEFLSWGWRVPFLLSIVVVGLGLYLRLQLKETPAFAEVKHAHAEARAPIAEIFHTSAKDFFLAFGARIGENGGSYIFLTFVLAYLVQLGVPNTIGLVGVQLAAAAALVTLPLFGMLSDRIGRRPVFMGAAAFMLVFAFPYFLLLNTKSPLLVVVAIILSYAIGTMGMLAAELAFFCELFPTRVRYTGVALARELSAPIAGGIAPFIAVALLAWSGGQSWPVAVYVMIMALITLVSVYLAPETYRRDLKHIQDEHRATLQAELGADIVK
jgi:MFS transporter, MHS family, shikimate and dehydroshikimate transport protein